MAPADAGGGGALKCVLGLTSSGSSEGRARPLVGFAEAGGAPPVNVPRRANLPMAQCSCSLDRPLIPFCRVAPV